MDSQDGIGVGMDSFDCMDAAELARFWAAVLMRPVDDGATREFAMVGFNDDGPTWMFHRPRAELTTGDNRFMLDLDRGTSWSEQADRIESPGAERVSDNDQAGVRWVVFRDPERNTFRVFAPRPE